MKKTLGFLLVFLVCCGKGGPDKANLNEFFAKTKLHQLALLDIKIQVLIVSLNRGDIDSRGYKLLIKDIIEPDLNKLSEEVQNLDPNIPHLEKALNLYRQLVSLFQKRVYLNLAGGLENRETESKIVEVFLEEKTIAQKLKFEMKRLVKQVNFIQEDFKDEYWKLFLSESLSETSLAEDPDIDCSSDKTERATTYCTWQVVCSSLRGLSSNTEQNIQRILIGLLPRLRAFNLDVDLIRCLIKIRRLQEIEQIQNWDVISELNLSFAKSLETKSFYPTFFF